MRCRFLTQNLIYHSKNLAYEVVIPQLACDWMEGAYSLLHVSGRPPKKSSPFPSSRLRLVSVGSWGEWTSTISHSVALSLVCNFFPCRQYRGLTVFLSSVSITDRTNISMLFSVLKHSRFVAVVTVISEIDSSWLWEKSYGEQINKNPWRSFNTKCTNLN